MRKIFFIGLVFLLVLGSVQAGIIANIGMQGLQMSNPEAGQAVSMIMGLQDPTSFFASQIISQISNEVMKEIAEVSPEAAKAIGVYQQVDNYIQQGAEITKELQINENGCVEEGSIIFSGDEKSDISSMIGDDLEKGSFSVKNVEFSKEDGRSVLSCKKNEGETCLIKFGDNEIQTDSKKPAKIVINENGEIESAEFTTNSTGRNFNFGNGDFYVPANSRVYYKKESGEVPLVILEESGDSLGLENILKNRGEVIYEGENFKIGDYEILGIGENQGRVLIKNGEISRLFEDSRLVTSGVTYSAVNSEVYFNPENIDGKNYVFTDDNGIRIGGSGFHAELNNRGIFKDAFENDNKNQKTLLKVIPYGGEINIEKNIPGDDNFLSIEGKGDFDLLNGKAVISTNDGKVYSDVFVQNKEISLSGINTNFDYINDDGDVIGSYNIVNEEDFLFNYEGEPVYSLRQSVKNVGGFSIKMNNFLENVDNKFSSTYNYLVATGSNLFTLDPSLTGGRYDDFSIKKSKSLCWFYGIDYEKTYPHGLSNHKKLAITSDEFLNKVNDYDSINPLNIYNVLAPNPGNEEYSRYIVDPKNSGYVIDMKHFLKAGFSGGLLSDLGGDIAEVGQAVSANLAGESVVSAGDPQDYYSNRLGTEFFRNYYDPFSRKKMGEQIIEFLKIHPY